MNGEFDEMMLQETTLYNVGGLQVYSYFTITNELKYGFKIYDGFVLSCESAGFEKYSEAVNAMQGTLKLLKGEKEMVGTPRVPKDDILTTSPTRTYVVVTHDLVCPNEARFQKLELPEGWDNNSLQARYYYFSKQEDRAIRVLACISYEDYMATVTDIVEEVIFEPPLVQKKRYFDTRSTSLTEDMKEVRRMLDDWAGKNKNESTTYAMILRVILESLKLQEKTVAEIKEVLFN